ncbi:MAG TPA: Ig-like domain-containing protein [Patescibacteria group bacterium]|nr:Ig-like domain-containing protein [Patescibacteria group bacterium]
MRIINKKTVLFGIIFIFFLAIIILVIRTSISRPVVESTVPENEAVEILETSQISINFNTDIDERAKKDISVSISPETNIDFTWLSNTYKVIPKNSLANDTTYTIKVLYKSKEIYLFSFSTTPLSQSEIQKFGPQQTKDDHDFGEAVKTLVDKYPFYTSLPVRTNDYVVYYDFELQKFAITFLNSITESQKSIFIKDALLRIQKIGAKEPILYYTQP